ncbi:hypothetical protein ACHWQZ_G010964 [Mnemiopsis leidyi]
MTPTSLALNLPTKLFLGTYNFLVIIIGLFGNLCVLYCSVRHGAISMDDTTLAFIENLALADILISLLYYLPMLVTLVFDRWVFGSTLCWFVGFFSSHIPFLAEILVIMSIACYRVWVLKKPPDQRKLVTVTHVKVLISVIWFVVTIPVLYWAIAGAYATYSPMIYICTSSNHIPTAGTTLYNSTKVFTVVFVAVPMVIVFFTSVKIMHTICVHTLSVGVSLMPHIRSIITVNLICWAFLVSYVPIFVMIVLKSTGQYVPLWFGLFQTYAKSVHVIINPFIYVATNSRFRHFVLNKLRRREEERSVDTVGQEGHPLYDPNQSTSTPHAPPSPAPPSPPSPPSLPALLPPPESRSKISTSV